MRGPTSEPLPDLPRPQQVDGQSDVKGVLARHDEVAPDAAAKRTEIKRFDEAECCERHIHCYRGERSEPPAHGESEYEDSPGQQQQEPVKQLGCTRKVRMLQAESCRGIDVFPQAEHSPQEQSGLHGKQDIGKTSAHCIPGTWCLRPDVRVKPERDDGRWRAGSRRTLDVPGEPVQYRLPSLALLLHGVGFLGIERLANGDTRRPGNEFDFEVAFAERALEQ